MKRHVRRNLIIAILAAIPLFQALGQVAALPPREPSNLVVVPLSTNKADVVWTDNSINEAGFKIERKTGIGAWSELAVVLTNTTRYTDATLTPGSNYTYRVRAYNEFGDSPYSLEVAIASLATPPPPPIRSVTPGDHSITLTWDDTLTETGYKVERRDANTPLWAPVAKLATDTTSFTDSGLTAGLQYFYRVRAFNLDGESAFASEIAASPLVPPSSPPSNLRLTLNGRIVNLQWDSTASGASGFSIQRRIGEAGAWEILAANLNSAARSFDDDGLSMEAFYFYRMAAFNADGTSSYGNESGIAVLAAPVNLKVEWASTNQLGLSWQDLSRMEAGFKVEKSLDGTNFIQAGNFTGPNVTNFTVTGLTQGIPYWFRVRAMSFSGSSDTMGTILAELPRPPVRPEMLSVTYFRALTRLLFRWQDVSSNERRFYLEGSNDRTLAQPVAALLTSNTIVHVINGIAPASVYAFYRIAASNEWGLSPWSDWTAQSELIEPPTAQFLATPIKGYEPLTVTFADRSLGTVQRWDWVFNDGQTPLMTSSNPVPPPVTYATAGTYTVTLTVYGPLQSNTATRIITVDPAPTLTPDFAFVPVSNQPAPSGTAPLWIAFTNRSVGLIERTEWDFDGDGKYDSVTLGNLPGFARFSYVAPGVYSPSIRVFDSRGQSAIATRTNYVSVAPQPLIPAFACTPSHGEAPLRVWFVNQSSGTITNSTWDFDSANPGGEAVNPTNPIVYDYPTAGTYFVSLTLAGPSADNSTLVRSVTNRVTVVPRLANHAPSVGLATPQIYMRSMSDEAILDASLSSDPDGDPLFFSWREDPANPVRGLLPIGSESLSKVHLYFPAPGRYRFDVRVSDGLETSTELRGITVFVPGIKGRVAMDSTDGSVTVPDVRVLVYASQQDAMTNGTPIDVVVSDSRGEYVLQNIQMAANSTGQQYFVKMERQNFATTVGSGGIQPVMLGPEVGTSATNLSMSRGTLPVALAGLVVDATNRPIANLKITVLCGIAQIPPSTITDSQGRFQLLNVPQGNWPLEFSSTNNLRPETREFQIMPNMTNLLIRLGPTLTGSQQTGVLVGRVSASRINQPILGAKVQLGSLLSAESDARGVFTLSSVPVGRYTLTAFKEGFAPVRMPDLSITYGTNTVDLQLTLSENGSTIQGTIVDATSGLPVWRARVGIESEAGLLVRSDLSDHTGYFQLNDVPAGEQSFRVEANGYVTRSFRNPVGSFLNLNLLLTRDHKWRPLQKPPTNAPVALAVQSAIYLTNRMDTAILDGSASRGTNLTCLWREMMENPALGLLSPTMRTSTVVQVSSFPKPGTYGFELQVREPQGLMSFNSASVLVFVPGLAGNVHSSPSEGIRALTNAEIRVYANRADADAWAENYLDRTFSKAEPPGDFTLPSISTGKYWVVAHEDAGHEPYGPVMKSINPSAAAAKMLINMKRSEYEFAGRVVDVADTNQGLSNVRIVVDPGILAESMRTTTDADGNFRLAAVPAGRQPLMLIREGYRTQTETIEVSGVTTQLLTMSTNSSLVPARLYGTISLLRDGRKFPIPNAQIILGAGIARTFTDTYGRYEFSALPPGSYVGIIVKGGYRPTELSATGILNLAPGNNVLHRELVFSFEKGPAVRGAVVDANNDPVEGIKIYLSTTTAQTQEKLARSFQMKTANTLNDLLLAKRTRGFELLDGETNIVVETDGSGTFQLSGVPDGEQQLEIQMTSGSRFSQILNIVSETIETVIVIPDEMLFADWAQQFAGQSFPTNETDAMAMTNDFDGDKHSDWGEFIAGTDPTDSNHVFSAEITRPSMTNLTLTVPESSLSRKYDIVWQTNILETTWFQYGYETWGNGSNIQFAVTNVLQMDGCFFRVKVWKVDP